MNCSLDEILKNDDEVFDCFVSVAEELISEYKTSDYPDSISCLMGLMGTINSLKLAAFDLAEESDSHLYAIKTLLRPAIEHYLRFSYLYFMVTELKNDSAGQEYRKYSLVSETIALVKSQYALETDKVVQNKILKRLRQSHDSFDISNRELEQIVRKWSYKNIARKLDKTLYKKSKDKHFLKKLISNYSELSSFVHGGIYAEQYDHSAYSSDSFSKEIKGDISLFSFLAATARAQMLLLGCGMNSKFIEHYSEYRTKMTRLLDSMPDA